MTGAANHQLGGQATVADAAHFVGVPAVVADHLSSLVVKRVKLEIGTGAVRAAGSLLLATKKVEWLTAFRAVWRRR